MEEDLRIYTCPSDRLASPPIQFVDRPQAFVDVAANQSGRRQSVICKEVKCDAVARAGQ